MGLMRPRTRDRGGFPLNELFISTVLLILCVVVFFLLGRTGWPWYGRIALIVGSLYGIVFLLWLVLDLWEKVSKKLKSRGST